MKLFTSLILFLLTCNTFSQVVKKIYVFKEGASKLTIKSNNNDILNSIQSISKIIDSCITKEVDTVHVFFYEGVYQLKSTIQFSNTKNSKTVIIFEALKKNTVFFSGGEKLPNRWKLIEKTETGSLWQIKLTDTFFTKWNVNSLICNGKWINNATSDTFISNGPLPQFKKNVGYYDFSLLKKFYKDSLLLYSSFQYFPNNAINQIKDLHNAKLMQINSWEGSWHDLLSIDTANLHIYLANPSCYPVGFFPGNNRFVISNCINYFNKKNQWYYNASTNTLFFRCNNAINPNLLHFYIPRLKHLVIIEGNKQNTVKNIIFRNIQFGHAASFWGIHETSPDANVSIIPEKFIINEKNGFSTLQNSIACGESVLLKYASNCHFINCTFANSENYGLRIGENCFKNIVSKCSFNSLGGGGVIVGFDNYSIHTFFQKQNISITYAPSGAFFNASNCPSNNIIRDCRIENCGLLHKGTIGIGLMHANNSEVVGNYIKNLPYSGIAVGWWYFENMQSCRNNTVAYNYISNVMQLLADGGGIYTIGPQFGSKYQYNYIEQISQSKHAIGAKNNAFFFDVKSEGFTVDSNFTRLIQAQSVRLNESDSTKIVIRNNIFDTNKNSIQLERNIQSKIKSKNKFL